MTGTSLSSSSTPRASPITNNSTTATTAASVNQDSITSTTTSLPTFLDKLTTNLDTQTKNALILQALKDTSSSSSNTNINNEVLLPGERIIMFINNLRDVQDSRYGHLFVGSDEVGMSVCMRDCLDGMLLMDAVVLLVVVLVVPLMQRQRRFGVVS